MDIIKLLHLRGIWRAFALFLVNHVFAGSRPRYFGIKRRLLNSIGFEIGAGTRVVGPIECTGRLKVGKDCWIGKNLKVNGNGSVVIGDNCDIAPEVTFQTGGHKIGDPSRRAGGGYHQRANCGQWRVDWRAFNHHRQYHHRRFNCNCGMRVRCA